MSLLILVVTMNLMSKRCSANNSGTWWPPVRQAGG